MDPEPLSDGLSLSSRPRSRTGQVERITSETSVNVSVDLDGRGEVRCATGVGFFDHMLDQLGRHSGFDLEVEARGDLHVDSHHTVEDVGLALGAALSQALGDKRGLRRYGDTHVPMEEALVRVALDLSGRPYLDFHVPVTATQIGNYDTDLTAEFFTALTRTGGITMHVRLISGKNPHHIVEAVFKAVARALAEATAPDPRRFGEIPSTKGVL
ncbi:MAG: imidazoleglycerol-phosphate dehydratase HisB [Actinomycetota bacterium]